ncbi:MAG: hypothetical protein AAGI63_08980, partial [Planctomycetota bacterium]
MSWQRNADERSTVMAGCLIAVSSAALTGLMLFINGSLVMAVLDALGRTGPGWLKKPAFTQFVLFAVPVVLVVIEWM